MGKTKEEWKKSKPGSKKDMTADMCKYGFNLRLDSLRDNIWPNMVYAIHQILGERLCIRSEDINHGTL